ncbi:universal stress protein [Isoptericola sp. BMS4]|uniref:universal stress protein n=1 Tax=Isoptericola sp. BMS4 TaxID=2527875 RepID=UPI00141DFDCF|nr:universal stress protein [Isoptericola sp. BMS4]
MDVTKSYRWPHGVVVGFDGSPDSRHALEWAVATAARHEARLSLLTAYAAPYGMTGAYVDQTDVHRSYVDEARRAIADLGIPAPGEVGVEAFTGSAVHLLVRSSRTADLVVVGRSGRSGMERLVLGSVSAAMAATARGPAAVVPPGASTSAPERVVACVDPYDDPGPLLDLAFAEGRAAGRPVVLRHVFDPDPPAHVVTEVLGDPAPPVLQERAEALESWAGKYTDIEHTVEIRRGPAREALLEGVTPRDLLVLGGRRHPRVVGRLMGSVADAVLRYAPCAVVVAHERRDREER